MGNFRSNKPLGSSDVNILYANAANLDEGVNQRESRKWFDRFGVARKTWFGMEEDFQDFLASSGYQDIGDYAGGLIISSRAQVFRYQGELWRLSAAVEVPYVTTGDWPGEADNFVSTGDAVLRQQLGNNTDPSLGVSLIFGAGRCVASVNELRLLNGGRTRHALSSGYSVPGDGGGAEYYLDTADTTSPDDGGAVIVDAGGNRWKLLFRSFINVKQFGVKGDGIADDTLRMKAAIDFADGRQVYAPTGTYRVTDSIYRLTSATARYRNGLRLAGDGNDTVFIADANNIAVFHWDIGYTPTPAGAATNALKYTRGSELSNFLVKQVAGRTGCDGIYMVAAWNVTMRFVAVEGMSGRGLNAPKRSDINTANSDTYQSFSLIAEQCRFSGCTGWGVYLGAGQSPGLWRIKNCTITDNLGGGIYSTQGQFEFADNLVASNGTFGGNGGIFIDVVEGASYVPYIARNEFDSNHSYHIHAYRPNSARCEGNRFLSNTYSTQTGNVQVTTGGYMRPPVHCSLGSGVPTGYDINNCVFSRNFHRSPPDSSVPVVCYSIGGTPTFNLFENNQMDAASNSQGMVRYQGTILTAGKNTVIHDGVTQVGAPYIVATSSVGTAISGNSTPALVNFDTPITLSGGATSAHFVGGVFEIPDDGLYVFNHTTGFNAASVITARVGFTIDGGTIISSSGADSNATSTPIISASMTRRFTKGQKIRPVALHATSGSVTTLTGQAFSEFSGYKVPNT